MKPSDDPKDELSEILSDIRLDLFEIDEHAFDRMSERRVSRADIRYLGYSYAMITRQRFGRWKISGSDLDGDVLHVVCELKDKTIIITVIGD